MTGSPLRAVLAELAAGAPTLAEVARRTGLDADVVSAAVDHLIRVGRVSASSLTTGCPQQGCGSCSVGCGVPGAPRAALTALSVRPNPL